MTPPIATAAHLIQSEPWNVEAVAAASQTVIRHAAAMRVLISELTDATRTQRGLIELSKDRIDVAALVEEAAATVRNTDCDALVIVSRPPQPVYLDADPLRLGQIVTKLLTHACRFSGARDEIHVSLSREPDAVAITLRDTALLGPRVVDMHGPRQRSSAPAWGGFGVDLGVVKTLVHLHGGTLAVDPGLKRGWTVRVRLPA